MYTIVSSKTLDQLNQKLSRLQTENRRLTDENYQLKTKLIERDSIQTVKTGWSEIDELFEQIQLLDKEYRMIQLEAADILK